METKDVRIEKLTADPRNARKHSERNLAAIRASLESFGQQKPIVVSQDGVVVAGNGTLAAAVELGWETVAVVETALDTLDAKAYAVADNRTAELAEWDDVELAQVLDQLDESQLGAVGFSDEELAEICERFAPDISTSRLDEAEAQTDKAEELNEKWKVKRGDLWQIGDHRLLCGDATSGDDVGRLMGGEEIGAVITDPPYGIGATKQTLGAGKKEFYRGNWDSEKPSVAFLLNLSPRLILWGGNYFADELSPTNDWLCWWKKNDNRSFSEFELAWTNIGGNCRILPHHWAGEEKRHPTQKPVKVMAWCIEKTEGGILDPFLGSGTTMVAAEQLRRKCYGMEIEPKYCAVILERMSGMGLSPARIGNE